MESGWFTARPCTMQVGLTYSTKGFRDHDFKSWKRTTRPATKHYLSPADLCPKANWNWGCLVPQPLHCSPLWLFLPGRPSTPSTSSSLSRLDRTQEPATFSDNAQMLHSQMCMTIVPVFHYYSRSNSLMGNVFAFQDLVFLIINHYTFPSFSSLYIVPQHESLCLVLQHLTALHTVVSSNFWRYLNLLYMANFRICTTKHRGWHWEPQQETMLRNVAE